MAETHAHFILKKYIFMLDFCSYIFKINYKKMSTALIAIAQVIDEAVPCSKWEIQAKIWQHDNFRSLDKLMRSVVRALFLDSR